MKWREYNGDAALLCFCGGPLQARRTHRPRMTTMPEIPSESS